MEGRKLSELQKEYRAFFRSKMLLFGVNSPAELSKEKKSEFFTEIRQDWAKQKQSKKLSNNSPSIGEEPKQLYKEPPKQELKKAQSVNIHVPTGHKPAQDQISEKNKQQSDKEASPPEPEPTTDHYKKQIIKSEPNEEQTDDLRIGYATNNHFGQIGQYQYPVVKMPIKNSNLKLPRQGRSNQKGYKENDFYRQIQKSIPDIEMTNNVHMVIPNYNKPYEPDIVLYNKSINLYIDIEIDEPYDGYYRYPTHYLNPEDETKQDDIRDLFFTESGWIVIRFTEKQVHCEANECIDYIINVIDSIYNKPFDSEPKCENEHQWDYNQSIQWQKFHYREKYLGIDRFRKQYSTKEIVIDTEEDESIETTIHRTKKFQFDDWNSSIAFDEQTHKYLHPRDETGNAEYISVTTLIERFFPFDLNRYIERKAEHENRTEEDVLDEYLTIRDEAAEKGTTLHSQIENFLKGNSYDPDSMEFELFLKFYHQEIMKRNLIFHEAEKVIFSNKYNVAGTIDCLFRKDGKEEFVMIDWKRSKKLIIDGRPRKYGYGYALSELSTLDNSSYYRYCLQQNLYKQIVETEHSMKISSMKLVVLHENYSDYHIVDVPTMPKETKIILNSLKVKI